MMKNSSSSRAPAALSSKNRRKLSGNEVLVETMSRFRRASRAEKTATGSINCAHFSIQPNGEKRLRIRVHPNVEKSEN